MSKLKLMKDCLFPELKGRKGYESETGRNIIRSHRSFFSSVTNNGEFGYEVNGEIVIRHTTEGQVLVIVGQYPDSRMFTFVPAWVNDGESLARYIVHQLIGAWVEWKKDKSQKTPYEAAHEEGLCG